MGLIYIFCDEASTSTITLKGELYKYLVKARRHNVGDSVFMRAKSDSKTLYKYEILTIDAKSLSLVLVSSEIQEITAKKNLHIGWCIIDSKSIEKILPSLNEIGVEKISFIYCDRSQRNFKLDFKRLQRILEASMQQCGRSTFMEFDSYKSIKVFIEKFPKTKVFDFCDKSLDDYNHLETLLIGCEGGFSKDERELLASQDVFRLNTPMVLRSESAVLAVSSKVLL